MVNSPDQQVRQLYALANEEGEELARSFDWQVMRQQQLFTTLGTPEQPAAVPDDLDHFISNSFFNRSTMRPMLGPITPQQWQAIQAQPQLNRVFLAFIQRSGDFLITPTPPVGNTIAYEYISVNWAKSAGGTPQDQFLADTDETYLPERLFRYGIRWRFLAAKGLNYSEEMRTYEMEKQRAQARDGGNSELSSTGSDSYILSANLPEGGFPGPGYP